jgi:hypothetical protein
MLPTILPYVQAVKRAPVAETAAADARVGGGSTDPSGRSTEESTLTSCATPRPSLAAKEGAKVSAVQKMLGHSSAKMTLDTYTRTCSTTSYGVWRKGSLPRRPGAEPDSGRGR